MKAPTLSRRTVFLLTIPLALFIACVMTTGFVLSFLDRRLSHARLVHGLNGFCAALAAVSTVFLVAYARFDKAFFCFLPPLFLALLAMGAVVVTYKNETIASGPRIAGYIAGLAGISVAGAALLFLVVLWVLVYCGKFAMAPESDGIEDVITAIYEDDAIADD